VTSIEAGDTLYYRASFPDAEGRSHRILFDAQSGNAYLWVGRSLISQYCEDTIEGGLVLNVPYKRCVKSIFLGNWHTFVRAGYEPANRWQHIRNPDQIPDAEIDAASRIIQTDWKLRVPLNIGAFFNALQRPQQEEMEAALKDLDGLREMNDLLKVQVEELTQANAVLEAENAVLEERNEQVIARLEGLPEQVDASVTSAWEKGLADLRKSLQSVDARMARFVEAAAEEDERYAAANPTQDSTAAGDPPTGISWWPNDPWAQRLLALVPLLAVMALAGVLAAALLFKVLRKSDTSSEANASATAVRDDPQTAPERATANAGTNPLPPAQSEGEQAPISPEQTGEPVPPSPATTTANSGANGHGTGAQPEPDPMAAKKDPQVLVVEFKRSKKNVDTAALRQVRQANPSLSIVGQPETAEGREMLPVLMPLAWYEEPENMEIDPDTWQWYEIEEKIPVIRERKNAGGQAMKVHEFDYMIKMPSGGERVRITGDSTQSLRGRLKRDHVALDVIRKYYAAKRTRKTAAH
jgi:hypothetical protein